MSLIQIWLINEINAELAAASDSLDIVFFNWLLGDSDFS